MKTAGPWLVTCLVALALMACDGAVRSPAANVGRHLAMEVGHTASRVADRIADRPDARCGGLSLQRRLGRWPASTSMVEVSIVPAGAGVAVDAPWLTQLVRLRQDAAGNLAMVEITTHDLDGVRGRRSREIRRVGELWQVREDGQPFATMASYPAGGEILAEAIEGYDRLLAAAGPLVGDARTPDGLRLATLDDEAPLHCPLRADGRPLWLTWLADDWQVTALTAHVETDDDGLPVRRRLSMTLSLAGADIPPAPPVGFADIPPLREWEGGGAGIRLVLDETIKVGQAEAVHLAERRIAPAVDRGFHVARRLVRDRWADVLGLDVLGFYLR